MRIELNNAIISFDDSKLSDEVREESSIVFEEFLNLITTTLLPGFYFEYSDIDAEIKRLMDLRDRHD